ncbi:formate dehydrogenase subunit gamma [Roseateles aquatilis]|uniref:Formate dehydrogenase subunit gamma n=1 Tax=Roseateles aquatilis TaxID=431061 RepID=A0A246JFC8_9BURK|nr:formate dehydrogenase subunit gamma [Roseateles aquatilis]OWQ91386.1 formate dehydrogenase subunit gamma [Roseateles aquatilis]
MALLQRYRDSQRINHWIVALLFLCAGLSGLAFFHPSLFFLTNLFGGGPWTRVLHPYMGVAMVVAFVFLALQMWRDNLWTGADSQWMRQSAGLIAGRDKAAAHPAYKYNAGQKIVFWIMVVSLLILFVTGFMFWHAWFPEGNILMRRIAVVLHSASAAILILTIIIHVYAAIWVKGSIRAMTRGTVTETWAAHNHPLWHREVKERPPA